ncbi:MAG: hypothetical protein EU532_06775 [Promethearchaeota archaeon]|nr:MAG: hypothetical protein EU532_06775 [Candidatus Lokiarchaeota archaeon]
MLNALFIIQSETGILLFEKIFLQDLDDENMNIFSGFLTAIKQFTSQMVFNGSKELKSIRLGDYYVKISHISEINSDLAIFIDKDDEKTASKLMRPIIQLIIDYEKLFIKVNSPPEIFKRFDEKINKLILSAKIVDPKKIKKEDNVFKSIWAQKGAISTNLREELLNKKEDLLIHLKNEHNLIYKLILLEDLLHILQNLEDKVELIKIQKEIDHHNNEIKDTKMRLKYYLKNTKQALKDNDYKTAYSNLYSFSNKLQIVSKSHVQKKYYNLAKILMDKEGISKIEFSQAVSEILMMPENIEEYFP